MAPNPPRETTPFRAQISAIFEQWLEVHKEPPEWASVNIPSAHRLAMEIGVPPNMHSMKYQFGARMCLRRPGHAQSPVEYFSYSRREQSNTSPNVLSATIQDWLKHNAPPKDFDSTTPDPSG